MSVRLDRLLTLCFFHPLSKRRTVPCRVPILMYHRISDATDSRHPYYQTITSPARFAEQMQYLAEHHYTPLTLSQLLNAVSFRDRLRPVVLTFDDGYSDFYTTAYPVLASHKFSATMFLPTALIDHKGTTVTRSTYLSWSQVRELHKGGIEFGSHTVSHAKLVDLTPSQIHDELLTSKKHIEDELGKLVTAFSYPFAFPEAKPAFIRQLREQLISCGYESGVSTMLGTASLSSDPYFLPRIPSNGADDPPLFRAKLAGGYDWLHTVQRLKKIVTEYARRNGQG